MRKLNNYITFGLLFNGIFLLGNATNLLPEFIKGFCAALGLTLIFFGFYSEDHDVSKIRNFKRKIFSRLS